MFAMSSISNVQAGWSVSHNGGSRDERLIRSVLSRDRTCRTRWTCKLIAFRPAPADSQMARCIFYYCEQIQTAMQAPLTLSTRRRQGPWIDGIQDDKRGDQQMHRSDRAGSGGGLCKAVHQQFQICESAWPARLYVLKLQLQTFAESTTICRHVALARYFEESNIDEANEKHLEAYCNKMCDVSVPRRARLIVDMRQQSGRSETSDQYL